MEISSHTGYQMALGNPVNKYVINKYHWLTLVLEHTQAAGTKGGRSEFNKVQKYQENE